MADIPSDVWPLVMSRLPLGIAVVDCNGFVLWANPLLYQMTVGGSEFLLSATADSIIGGNPMPSFSPPSTLRHRSLVELLPDLDASEWQEALTRICTGATTLYPPERRRVQSVHPGTRHILHWQWSLQPADDQQPPQHLLFVMEEVTEIVLSEQMLASSARNASHARRRAEALARLSQRLNAAYAQSDLLRVVMEEVATLFDTSHAAILEYQPSNRFRPLLTMGLAAKQAGFADTTELNAHRMTQDMPAVVEDAPAAGIVTPVLDTGEKAHSILSCPLRYGERLFGLLELYFPEMHPIPADARRLLHAFADQASIGLQRAELFAEIAEKRRQLQSIFDHAPVAIIYFDAQGGVVAANRTAAERFDRSVSAMMGCHHTDVLRDFPEAIFTSVASGTPFHASHWIFDHPVEGRTLSDVSIVPVRDDRGSVVGMLLLAFDVTEMVRVQQELDVARQQAERALIEVQAAQAQMVQMEKMRAIGELASGVAHDFNNALMTIMGYAELAESNLDSPEQIRNQLEIIQRAAEDARSLVRRLNQFAGRQVAMRGTLEDVNQIVQDVIEMTRPRWKDHAQRQGQTYQIETHLGVFPRAVVEPSGLREVLINLIHNALNAMPEGGTLRLTTRGITHNGNDSEGNDPESIEIEVADTGVGMTPEVIARIWDPFFTTRGVEGTGLGLSVSWTIIQRHGGTIEAFSTPGQGTRMVIRLPLGDRQNARPAVEYPSGVSVQNTRLLVVDDDPFVASVLSSLLFHHGNHVDVETSAQAALERLAHAIEAYDLVLSDHGMPGMTGLQLVAEIRRLYPQLPVILLTGWGEALLDNHHVETMPDAILAKPINQSELHAAVATVLSQNRAKAKRSEP